LRADALSGSLAPAQLRARLAAAQVRFESAYRGCKVAIEKQRTEAEKRLGLAAASLDALSPLAVLQRGYAIAQKDDGTLLRDAKSVSIGDKVRVRLARGTLGARVDSVDEV
jgi:exodeoxyribonuclease VII large subunit